MRIMRMYLLTILKPNFEINRELDIIYRYDQFTVTRHRPRHYQSPVVILQTLKEKIQCSIHLNDKQLVNLKSRSVI